MSTLEHFARYESPHSGLAFRRAVYGPGDDADALVDCLALANAELKGRRYLMFGVDDSAAGDARLIGVGERDLERFGRRLKKLIAAHVEPALNAAVRALEVDGRLIGYIRIKDCVSPPYLVKRSLGDRLHAGQGFVRRGSSNFPLHRSDMQKMFARDRAAAPDRPAVRVGFPGKEPLDSLSLPALDVQKLPSELAAERIRSLMTANDQARDLFGRTETRFSRLMHAKLYGVEVPFEKKGDDTLVSALENVNRDYRAADEHYLYEVRSHRLNIVVANESKADLHDAILRITIPRIDGTGIAERIYTEDESELPPEGYPAIAFGRQTLSLEARLGTLYAGRSVRAFREPARFWAREAAAGRAVPVDYALVAGGMAQPVKGSLIIYIDKASLKSV